MATTPLDNPIWASLQTEHARFASGSDAAKRYPRTIAPFAAVPASAGSADVLAATMADDESIYFLGPLPTVSECWNLELEASVLQMTCPPSASLAPLLADYRDLTEADNAAMLELTTLVFPGYFRDRTLLMGRYLGIFADGLLVAMAGERMRLSGHCEISAVCTRPGFTGRGYAGMLVSLVAKSLMSQDVAPFLHVSPENHRARAVYRSLGFVERCELPLIRVRAASSVPGDSP
jgi:GNAT superfamily N-acetyltransferase